MIQSVRVCPPSPTASLPTVLLAAGIHGDEPVGAAVLVNLLCRLGGGESGGRGTDEFLLSLGRSVCVEFAPVVNPDGLASNARESGAGVDLNREAPVIPYHAFSPGTLKVADVWEECEKGTGQQWQPEVCALTARLHAEPPVLSTVFHGGALVANYPWDGRPDKSLQPGLDDMECPDAAVARWVSLRYAAEHPRMAASSAFDQGITNGAAWYPVYGSWQDYVYGYTGRMSITVELDDVKRPPSYRLTTLVSENVEPIIAFLDAGDTGVRGYVRAVNTGLPLANARISFSDGVGVLPVYSDDAGFYVQLLVPGTTTDLIVEAPGYERLVIGSLTTVPGPMMVNVSLAVDLDATTGKSTPGGPATTAGPPPPGTTPPPGGSVDVEQDAVARHADVSELLSDSRLAGAAASLALGIIGCVCTLCVAAGSMAGIGVPAVAANLVAGRPALARPASSHHRSSSTRPAGRV